MMTRQFATNWRSSCLRLFVARLSRFNSSILLAEPGCDVQGKLNTYNYFDNVWQFDVSDVTFKLTPRAQGSLTNAPKITADKLKIICVDAKLCQAAP